MPNKAATRIPKKHASSLQFIVNLLPLHISKIETIDIIKKPPSWTSPIETNIHGSAEEAIVSENENEDNVKIYTDETVT